MGKSHNHGPFLTKRVSHVLDEKGIIDLRGSTTPSIPLYLHYIALSGGNNIVVYPR